MCPFVIPSGSSGKNTEIKVLFLVTVTLTFDGTNHKQYPSSFQHVLSFKKWCQYDERYLIYLPDIPSLMAKHPASRSTTCPPNNEHDILITWFENQVKNSINKQIHH